MVEFCSKDVSYSTLFSHSNILLYSIDLIIFCFNFIIESGRWKAYITDSLLLISRMMTGSNFWCGANFLYSHDLILYYMIQQICGSSHFND